MSVITPRTLRFGSAAVLVALSASVLPVTAVADNAPPRRTECATPDPTWVRDGIEVMQTLGPADAPGTFAETFFSLEVAPEVTDPVSLNPGGYQRLWDMGVAWTDVNPAPGVFDWSILDQRVAQVEEAGAKAMYVLGLTPQWAAANPQSGDPRWGLGTASRPSDLATWSAYVRAVAERYNGQNGVGKIWAFEAWNEANIVTFWDNGGPSGANPFGMRTLAEMTRIAKETIDLVNPDAILIAATTTTRVRGADDRFGGPQLRYLRYLEALQTLNYPFDAWGIHSYPAGNAGPTQRIQDVTCWQEIVVRHLGKQEVEKQVKDHKAKRPTLLGRPIFDTELNFGLAGPGTTPSATYTPVASETLVWRAYIDSARLGIDSTTWYLYTADTYTIAGQPMGVQLFAGQSTVDAYGSVRSLMLDNMVPFRGCSNLGKATKDGALQPTVQSCELAAFDRPSATAEGVWLAKGFVIFAEDAFSAAAATNPFVTQWRQPLVPYGSGAGVFTQVTSVGGAPNLVLWIRGR
jgi:hypothetical protein